MRIYDPGSVWDARGEIGPRLCDVAQDYDLGLDDYPIWDETKRDWLNQRIIDHFWLRQIGADTPRLFIFYLNRRMRERMPGINPVFQALETTRPLDNMDVTERRDATGTANAKAETSQQTSSESQATSVSDGTTDTSSQSTRTGDGTTSGSETGTATGTSRSLTSMNPNTSMTAERVSDYYDQGVFADQSTQTDSKNEGTSHNEDTESTTSHGTTGDTTNSSQKSSGSSDSTTSSGSQTADSETRERAGREGVLLTEALDKWTAGVNNALQLVFDVLEPCFTQFFTDHYNMW